MATRIAPLVPLGEDPSADAAVQQQPWRMDAALSSAAGWAEHALDAAGFDRAPWLAVALGVGIAGWFVLPSAGFWIAYAAAGLMVAALGAAFWRGRADRARLRGAAVSVGLLVALGVAVVWARSAVVGAEPLPFPRVEQIDGRVLAREDQPAQDRVRLTLAYREAQSGRALKVRVNVPSEQMRAEIAEGARVRLRARLMPPAPPMIPGAFDFARTAGSPG
jgi:competence protein ComEC